MDEERVCECCDKTIKGNRFKTLGDETIVCNACFKKACKQCAVCEQWFLADNMQSLDDDDDTLVCEECYDNGVEKCEICEGFFPEDEMTNWGEACICPNCLEERCPSFDPEEVEKETQEAYDAFCKKYIGKKVADHNPGEIQLDMTVDDEAPTCYSISVTIDDEGHITEISRLKASMLLSDWERGSDWRDYRITSRDYDYWAEDLLTDNLEFEE